MKTFTKVFVNSIIGIICVVGLIGVFKGSPVDIESFSKFVTSFAAVFAPLLISVAAGGEVKRYTSLKFKNGVASIDLQPKQESQGGK